MQLYFDEQGVARYLPGHLNQAAVEKEVEKHQEFIERWLAEVQPPVIAKKQSPVEEELKKVLIAFAKILRNAHFAKSHIAVALEKAALLSRSQWASLTEEQAKAIADDISSIL